MVANYDGYNSVHGNNKFNFTVRLIKLDKAEMDHRNIEQCLVWINQ